VIEKCLEKGIRAITIKDAAYPERLRNIYAPPVVLYMRGHDITIDDEICIAMVGTRGSTMYGNTCAYKLGYALSKAGAVIVSGLAQGIDGRSIEGAIKAGGRVISVLGCGADVIYPSFHKELMEKIMEKGMVVTEYEPGAPAIGRHFPVRNRIISGLSQGCIVVEADRTSGALITAGHALEQGRDVFAVPGNIDNETSSGTNWLIKQGAKAITSPEDVIEEYDAIYPGRLDIRKKLDIGAVYFPEYDKLPKSVHKAAAPAAKYAKRSAVKEEKEDKETAGETVSKNEYFEKDISSLNADENKIYSVLSNEPKQIDLIISETGLTVSKVAANLLIMEVNGFVKSYPGKRFSRSF
jgi:DNA processing protein